MHQPTQIERLKLLPMPLTAKQIGEWRDLIDAELVLVSDQEGDFGPVFILELAEKGRKALDGL